MENLEPAFVVVLRSILRSVTGFFSPLSAQRVSFSILDFVEKWPVMWNLCPSSSVPVKNFYFCVFLRYLLVSLGIVKSGSIFTLFGFPSEWLCGNGSWVLHPSFLLVSPCKHNCFYKCMLLRCWCEWEVCCARPGSVLESPLPPAHVPASHNAVESDQVDQGGRRTL